MLHGTYKAVLMWQVAVCHALVDLLHVLKQVTPSRPVTNITVGHRTKTGCKYHMTEHALQLSITMPVENDTVRGHLRKIYKQQVPVVPPLAQRKISVK